MPLIVSPTDAAVLIGAKCGGSSPDVDDPNLIAILMTITTRLEGVMNVDSLSLGEHIDRFYLDDKPLVLPERGPLKMSLRLSNGYVDPTTLVLTDEDGTVIEAPTAEKVNRDLGIVDLHDWSRGYYTLEYTSGFDNDENPDGPTLIGTPAWMKPVISAFLVQWYRTVFLSAKLVKGQPYEAMMNALYRQIAAMVHPYYQRPRMGVVWGEKR